MNNKPYIPHPHISPEINTVSKFLSSATSVAKGMSIKDFLSYKGDTDKMNIERIYEKYNVLESKQYEGLINQFTYKLSVQFSLFSEFGAILFKVNTTVLIPTDKANREALAITGKNQVATQRQFTTFLADKLEQLLSDPLYTPSVKYNLRGGSAVQDIYPYITVWMWVRSLEYPQDEYTEAQVSELLNQVRQHKQVNTGVDFNKIRFDESFLTNGSMIDITPFIENISINVTKTGGNFSMSLAPITKGSVLRSGNGFVSDSNVFKIIQGKIKENDFLFHKIINTNDLVFIKFEKLEIEKLRTKEFSMNVSKSKIANQIYDMIGLVDSNTLATNYGSNDVNISITGRDLIKPLIEDGSYFYALQYATDIFLNTQEDDRLIKRLFSSGKYDELLMAYSFYSIPDVMKFIINHLANLGIVPDDLFTSYRYELKGEVIDRRTYVYRLNNENPKLFSERLHEGIWQIIKLLFDENIADRRIADSSISQPDGSLINSVWKVCQEPFVEFMTDTYGDEFYYTVRQPPFTGRAVLDFINKTLPGEDEVGYAEKTPDLLNQVQLRGQINTPVNVELKKERKSILLSISPADVLSKSLSYTEDGIYSFYEIQPKGAFLGLANQMALAYIPIVYFPLYANIWGAKRLSVVSNYISYSGIEGEQWSEDRNYFLEQVVNDLKFLIDCNAYVPFTRSGTITINGDRRIKRGTWIEFELTDEIFYVDAVSNNFSISTSSIDRVTTLSVSRGMKKAYLTGEISYFNIVDSKAIKDFIIERLTKPGEDTIETKMSTKLKTNFAVNEKVFNFFLKRRQFDE